MTGLSSSFDDFMREILEEAHDGGPNAEAAFFESQQRHWIGQRLFVRRRALGYTERKLAALSGINQADISKIEHAEANPTLDTLVTLAAALRLTLVLEAQHEAIRPAPARRQQKHTSRRVIDRAAVNLRTPALGASRRAAAKRGAKVGVGVSAGRATATS